MWASSIGSTSKEPEVTAHVRIIVTRRTLTHKEHARVGYRVGAQLFELFAADLDAEGFTGCDVLDVFFTRGGFEHTLGQEDREVASDRWVSGNPHGQELWQILCQWVWNKRIALGLQQAPMPLRVTVFRERIERPVLPPPPDVESHFAACADTTAVAESSPVETTAVAAESSPVETTAVAESSPVETTAVAESSPVETTAVAESSPVETTAVAESSPVETTAVAESSSVEAAPCEAPERPWPRAAPWRRRPWPRAAPWRRRPWPRAAPWRRRM